MNNLLHKFCHQVLLNDLFIFIIGFFFLHKDTLSDQTSQIEQTTVDHGEVDRQKMAPSISPTSPHFQKHADKSCRRS